MTGLTLILSSWLAMLVIAPRAPAIREKVTILATEPTRVEAPAADQPGYDDGSFDVEDLIRVVPQLESDTEPTGGQVVQLSSPATNDAVWLELGRRLDEVLRDPAVAGVVITHGVETIEETAYFLSLVARSDKPIVMTSVMRSMPSAGDEDTFSLATIRQLPRVEIVSAYESAGRDVVDSLVESGVQGIVLADANERNSSPALLAGLDDAAARGVAIVRCVHPSRALARDELRSDFVRSTRLSPRKARVLLMLALTRTSNRALLQQYFDRH